MIVKNVLENIASIVLLSGPPYFESFKRLRVKPQWTALLTIYAFFSRYFQWNNEITVVNNTVSVDNFYLIFMRAFRIGTIQIFLFIEKKRFRLTSNHAINQKLSEHVSSSSIHKLIIYMI